MSVVSLLLATAGFLSLTVPDSADPALVSRRITEQFLSTVPDRYCPEGFKSTGDYPQQYGSGRLIHYSVVSLWLNALECARLSGNAELERKLVERFEPYYVARSGVLPEARHVDLTIVGALPLEIAILTGDARARALGLRFADLQWEKPGKDDPPPPGYPATPYETRLKWWTEGFSDQTRLWIDDTYMITVLQSQAYRLTGDRKYIDRAAREMALYLGRIQRPDGLFYHAPDAPHYWARGCGWMAAGMALLLRNLPADSEQRGPILSAYRKMMAALLARQNDNGMWNQLVGDRESWQETSGTAMFTYAFIEGAKRGWLEDAAKYEAAARKAYLALVDRLDAHANLADVCCGTGARKDRSWYLARSRVNGDPHGQAPMLWICAALLGRDSFPIEWRADAPTDIPYEVELSPAKLERLAGIAHGSSYAVTATDEQGVRTPLAVTELPGRTEDLRVLRFSVPAGTKALEGEAVRGHRPPAASPDNPFAGALENTDAWRLPKGVTVKREGEGLLFASANVGSVWAECPVDVPEGAAGKPVKLEIDCVSRTPRLTWGGEMKIAQLDAQGRLLPESVSDPRWTGHMRPPGKVTRYRECGRIHPRARKLVFRLELRGADVSYDAYGLPVRDPAEKLPKLFLSRLALRLAAPLPFPKYDDRFFAAGVSGRADDFALRLDRSTTFWYQTRGPAAWSEGHEYVGDGDLFYPVCGAGTVEAWFRPDWSGDGADGVFLFQGFQGYLISGAKGRNGQGEVLGLRYWPKTDRISLRMKDDAGKVFSGEGKAAIADGKWTHVAVTWAPGRDAVVWVDGEARFRVPLPGFAVPDLNDPKALTRNDRSATEFFVGSSGSAARREGRTALPKYKDVPFFTGLVDGVRVSSGERYASAFKPSAELRSDDATRAFFGFDRSYDGVSAYGLGAVSGSFLAETDRLDHRLTVGGRTIPYFPAELPAEHDPRKVLDVHNYPELPTESDFRTMRRTVRRTFALAKGGTERFAVDGRVFPDFVEIANRGDRPLVHPIALNAGEVDPRSFGDIAETMKLDGLDDRGRANAIFRFVLGASDYYRNHTVTFAAGSDKAASVEYEALTMLNGYCGFECGPLNNMTANLFSTVAGLPASQTLGYGHSFEQVFFDGKNHIYDLSAQTFFPTMDNESSANLGEVDVQPGVLARFGRGSFNFARSGTRRFWVQTPSYREKVAFTLNPGERFRAWFLNDGTVNDVHMSEKATPAAMCGACAEACAASPNGREIRSVDRFFPHYGNGFLVYDGRPAAGNPAFSGVEGDSFCYRVRSCYPVVGGDYAAELEDGSRVPLELSTDFGKTWRPFASPATYAVRARSDFLVRVRAPIGKVRRFRAATEVQFNPRIFPGRVRSGENAFRLRATSSGEATVTVQYRVEGKRRLSVGGTLESGVIPGCENLTLVLDPARGLSVPVSGLSPKARIAKTRGPLQAELKDGRLVLSSAAERPFVGGVVLADGEETRLLTVVVCRGARVLKAASVADGGRRFVFSGAEKGTSGPLSLWTLTRGEADSGQGKSLELTLPNGKRLVAGKNKNVDTEFLKAPYGPAGGRSAWRWDYVHQHPDAYPYLDLRRFSAEELSGTLAFDSVSPQHLEMQAVLLLPYPDRDFRRDLVKTLCGLNCQPQLVEP